MKRKSSLNGSENSEVAQSFGNTRLGVMLSGLGFLLAIVISVLLFWFFVLKHYQEGISIGALFAAAKQLVFISILACIVGAFMQRSAANRLNDALGEGNPYRGVDLLQYVVGASMSPTPFVLVIYWAVFDIVVNN